MPTVTIPEVHPVALEMLMEEHNVGMEIANSHTEHTMRVVADDLTRLERVMETVQENLDDVEITGAQWTDAMAPFIINNTVTNTEMSAVIYDAATTQTTTMAIPGNALMCGSPGRSPESDYFLDGLFSCNDITPDVDRFVRMAGFNMDNWLDNYDWNENRRTNHGENLMMSGRALRQHYLEWRETAPANHRAAVTLSSLYGLSAQLSEFLWSASDKCAIKLLQEPPERPLEDVILNPDFIGQTILGEERLAHWVSDVEEFFTFLHRDYEEGDPDGILQAVQTYINRPRTVSAYMNSINANMNVTGTIITNCMWGIKPKPIDKRVIKRVRQAVKRSSALFERIIGKEELRWFLAGKPFRISGELFTYEIGKTQSVVAHTANPRGAHVPYNLTILDGEKRLCKVCIYFDKTPLLDQITALAMFIKSGEEEALIHKANMFDRCADYDEHPIMRRLGKTRVSVVRGNAVRTTDAAQIENTIRAVADESFIQTFGVSNLQFKEEVVPWRARMRDPILSVFSNMVGMPERLIQKIANADRNGDEMAFWRRLNAGSADAFIEHNFA